MRIMICALFIAFGWHAALSQSRRLKAELARAAEKRVADALTLALGDFLPMCAHCKSIRNEKDEWIRIEEYIRRHSDTDFTHGICPSCVGKYYSQPTVPAHPEAGD
jgi:hypothetical protein